MPDPIDPFVSKLAEKVGLVIGDPSSRPKVTPAPEDGVANQLAVPLADQMARQAEIEEARKKNESAPPPAPAAPAPTPAVPQAQKAVKLAPATPQLSIKQAPAPAPTPSPSPAATPPPNDPNEGLTESQLEELSLARFAETHNPAKYPGHEAKMRDYFKKLNTFVSEHPHLTPEDADFEEFVNTNRPKYQEGDRRKLERAQLIDEAKQQAANDMRATMEKQQAELRAVRTQASRDAQISGFMGNVGAQQNGFIPKALVDAVQSGGFTQELLDKYPVEAPILFAAHQAATNYVNLVNGVAEFDARNSDHVWLFQFLKEQERLFMRDGGASKVVNGRTFATREAIASMTEQERAAHWTFSDAQVLAMIQVNAQKEAEHKIRTLEKGGYVRAQGHQPAPASPNPPKGTSPHAGIQPAPGPTASGQPDGEIQQFFKRLYPGAEKFATG
jgi:hypothetical protein